MKSAKYILVGTIALAAASNAMAQTGYIVNTKHNFSSYAWSNHEICKPCHTPHFSDISQPRLWNHTLTTATYQMHDGSAGTAVDNFDYASRMCLSCHDGTVALDSFGGSTTTGNFIPNGDKLGTDLRDDHPVGSEAEYPPDPKPSWWDGAFKATPTSGLSLKNWTDKTTNKAFKVVGCTTCHTPHGKGFPNLLNISNDASGVCLGCHIK